MDWFTVPSCITEVMKPKIVSLLSFRPFQTRKYNMQIDNYFFRAKRLTGWLES